MFRRPNLALNAEIEAVMHGTRNNLVAVRLSKSLADQSAPFFPLLRHINTGSGSSAGSISSCTPPGGNAGFHIETRQSHRQHCDG
jgi:hypothetical protein